MSTLKDRKIIVINQATNYLTIGFCNAFQAQFNDVTLLTGSIHTQGEELDPRIKVHHLPKWVERPAYKKAMAYLTALFSIYFLLLFKYRKHEVFFVSIPPMAYLLTIVLPHRFSMVIWDVYPDVFKITGMKESHPLYRFWAYLNTLAFKKAYRLFTIGERMGDLVAHYVDRKKIIIQPIWSIFQENKKVPKEENPFIQEHQLQGKFIVQYSGNIGLTHKVEVVVKLAELLKEEKDIVFQIIGRGSREPMLQRMVEEKKLPNCYFLPFQSDEMFPYSLSAADIGVVILDELTSKGSVPSKSYNLMSYGIPSLYIAGRDSELNDYAKKFAHAACFMEQELYLAKDFITTLSKEQAVWEKYSKAAEKTANRFKRSNADNFVALYLESD